MIHGAKGLRALGLCCFAHLVRWHPFAPVSLCGEVSCHPLVAANAEPGWGLERKSMWWPVLRSPVSDFYVRCESRRGHASSSQMSHVRWDAEDRRLKSMRMSTSGPQLSKQLKGELKQHAINKIKAIHAWITWLMYYPKRTSGSLLHWYELRITKWDSFLSHTQTHTVTFYYRYLYENIP